MTDQDIEGPFEIAYGFGWFPTESFWTSTRRVNIYSDLELKTWVEVASPDEPDEPGLSTEVKDYEEAHRLALAVFNLAEVDPGMMGRSWVRDADGRNQEIPHPPNLGVIGNIAMMPSDSEWSQCQGVSAKESNYSFSANKLFKKMMQWIRGLGSSFLAILLTILFVALAGPALVYIWGLSIAGETPSQTTVQPQAPLVRMIFWSEVEAAPKMAIRRLSPWSFVTLVACTSLHPTSSSHCDTAYTGHRIALRIARHLAPDELRGIKRHFAEAALMIWLSRHWTAEDLVDASALHSYFGDGVVGIDAAAARYFGKPAEALAPHEVGFLAALIRAPARLLRQASCDPEAVLELLDEMIARAALNPTWPFGPADQWVGERLEARLPLSVCPGAPPTTSTCLGAGPRRDGTFRCPDS